MQVTKIYRNIMNVGGVMVLGVSHYYIFKEPLRNAFLERTKNIEKK